VCVRTYCACIVSRGREARTHIVASGIPNFPRCH
jgi:hypothetical protein